MLAPSEPAEEPAQPFVSIPSCRDPDFVDRGDILDQIGRRCAEPPYRAALVGLGGVGKSQLAIEFAYSVNAGGGSIRSWVFWVHASTRTRVEEGFWAIAEAVKLVGRSQPRANIPRLVYNWLSNEQGDKWVMVLDSADDLDVFYGASEDACEGQPLATFLPQSSNGSILVTTRNEDLATRLTGAPRYMIKVGPMTKTGGSDAIGE